MVANSADSRKWPKSYSELVTKHLWGSTGRDAVVRAYLQGITADFNSHEIFYIVAPQTMIEKPSLTRKEEILSRYPYQWRSQ